MDIQHHVPLYTYTGPVGRGKGVGEKEVVDVFFHIVTAKKTKNIWLDIIILPE